ncbi:hypothetical protein DOM21_09020 [Bacteriovorax stolpii]|nr:hypothetical protein [Bacteriovorax stolpii]QDK41590.1 hypothetical protein DOM21_09020 [Bacteriovorax stolpii]TDP50946.1 hypothetical protein C8D79_3685 [Bacteriovorax stolpii]
MNRFIKASLLCCLLQSSFVFADSSKTFNYENQPEEVFNLENYLKEIIEIDKVISKGNISYEYVANGNYTVVIVDLKAEGAKVGSILTGAKTEFMTNVSFTQNYIDAGEMILSKIQDFTWKQSKVFYLEK